jgi:LuxR family maltose regulon positive regulatory protein
MATTSPLDARPRPQIGQESLVIPFPGRAGSVDRRAFRPPAARAEDVPRRDLVARLVRAAEIPLVVVSAPAGYGKTTLLAQWAEADPRSFAWLRIDAADDDPFALRTRLLLAVDAAVARSGGHSVLVLDDAHLLRAPETLRMVASLVDGLPPGAQVALGCRELPALPLGRLAAERRLLQLGAEDLALDEDGASALLRAAGAELDPGDAHLIARRAEGWPAALSLAGLALGERGAPAGAERFAGDDAAVAEYLGELLAPLPSETIDFLTRTSVLDRLCGPLCDALLGRIGSGLLLRDLRRANLLVFCLDRREQWYRYHGLLAEMLRAELRRREPERATELHRRASRWLEEHGEPDAAARHARAGGDLPRAAALLWSSVPGVLGHGGLEALEAVLREFPDDEVAASAPLALTAAWCSLERRGELVDGWISVAEHDPERTPRLRAAVALLRAAVGRDGVQAMRDEAILAQRLEPHESPWRALACLLEGIGRDLMDDPRGARALLEEGVHRAGRLQPAVAARCLSRLAVLALEEDSWDRATELALRARDLAERRDLRDHPSMAAVYPAAALVLARGGRAQEAKGDILHSERLLEMSPAPPPWLAVEARILLGRASVLVGDLGGARSMVRAATRSLAGAGESPVLRRRLEAIREATSIGRAPSAPGGSLTTAEVRVLRYLPTHLSFREIAERLYVSRNTVKSQAISVYRKLDASSRSEAIERAVELGLVDEPVLSAGGFTRTG